MVAALQNFKDAVRTVWQNTSPEDDGSDIGYSFIDDVAEDQDNGQHRQLIWRLADEVETKLEIAEDVKWTLVCELFIHRDPGGVPRSYRDFSSAAENEAMALQIAFNSTPGLSLGTNVTFAQLLRTRFAENKPTQRPPASGGVNRSRVIRVEFFFHVETQEA